MEELKAETGVTELPPTLSLMTFAYSPPSMTTSAVIDASCRSDSIEMMTSSAMSAVLLKFGS